MCCVITSSSSAKCSLKLCAQADLFLLAGSAFFSRNRHAGSAILMPKLLDRADAAAPCKRSCIKPDPPGVVNELGDTPTHILKLGEIVATRVLVDRDNHLSACFYVTN